MKRRLSLFFLSVFFVSCAIEKIPVGEIGNVISLDEEVVNHSRETLTNEQSVNIINQKRLMKQKF